MLGGILGVIGMVTGLAKKADDSQTAQKILEGIDHLNLSDEEKIKYVIEQKKLDEAGENSIKSVTRRILAVIIIGTAFSFLWLAVIFWWFKKEFSDYILEILKLNIIIYPVSSVVIFYFGYYGITKIVEKFKGK